MIVLKQLLIIVGLSVACWTFKTNYNLNSATQIGDLTEWETYNGDFDNLDVELQQMDTVSDVNQQYMYVLGARVPNDRLVAHAAKDQYWRKPQNVTINLTYPGRGTGALVTYVRVKVDQSSPFGRAWVLRGGIHEHYITVIIEANRTTYANYRAEMYGL